MKKYAKIIAIFLGLTFFLSCFYINFKNDELSHEKLININDVTEKFMNEFYEGVASFEDNKENVLIVTAEEIKDTFGAKQVVNAPNHQFFLEYETEEEKNIALKKLKTDDDLLYVGENITYSLAGEVFNSWGIEKIGLDDAIKAVNGYENANDVVVAIIDTGLDVSLFNSYYEDKLFATYNVLDKSSNVSDSVGHGTHIAGTIAEGTPDNVKLLPIKVSNSDRISNSDIIAAIDYVTKNNLANVINMSFTSEVNDQNMYVAIAAANANNIICVAAAGNEATNMTRYPAGFDNTISISAVDSNLYFADFSNFGTKITFAAPGVKILSINGTGNGTSMATPHAVNAVAILKSFNIDLTLEDTIELLKKYTIDLGSPGRDNYYGYGLISLENAMFCDGTICDEYGVFKESIEGKELTKIMPGEVELTSYNYGSVNNILSTEIKLYYENVYVTKKLWELEDVQINGYDPHSEMEQNVEVHYQKFSTTIKVTNPSTYPNGWSYQVVDGKAELTSYKDNSKGFNILYFPEKIDGYDVVSLVDNPQLNSKIFVNSEDFKLFETIVLSKNITKLGRSSLIGASKLKKLISLADSLYIGDYALYQVSTLESITGNINYVGNSSFNSCTNLKEITLQDSITSIGSNAFANCSNLKYLSLPSELISIGNYAFTNTGLESLFIPKNVTSIGSSAFGDCQSLEKISVSSDNTVYDSRNNSNSIIETSTNKLILGIAQTIIPNSVLIIGNSAFANNLSLKEINIPDGVQSIESNAFYGCDYLENIYIPDSLTSIGADAFKKYSIIHKEDGSQIKSKLILETNSYAKDYARQNNIDYEYSKISFIRVDLTKDNYQATENVSSNDIKNVILYYDYGEFADNTYREYTGANGKSETNTNYQIIYQNGEKFKYGDSYYIIKGSNKYGEIFEKQIDVSVSRADIKYTVENNNVIYNGQKHGITINVQTPSEYTIRYKDANGNYTLDTMPFYSEIGEHTIEFRITASSDYKEVFGSGVVYINKDVLKNDTKDYEGIYDGKEHTITLNINVPVNSAKYSIGNTNYNLINLPKFSSVGEYNVNYKINGGTIYEVVGSNKVKIYGIKNINNSIEVKNNIFVINSSSFNSLKRNITTYALNTKYLHYDSKRRIVTDDLLKTGQMIGVRINNEKDFEYLISLLGDVTGDGKITSADYVKIRKHIMKSEVIGKDVNIYAADVNKDNKITSADYVRIRKYIMNGGNL